MITAHTRHPRLRELQRDHSLIAHPHAGAERETWWQRAVTAWPDYAEYQKKTTRTIPVFVLTPAGA